MITPEDQRLMNEDWDLPELEPKPDYNTPIKERLKVAKPLEVTKTKVEVIDEPKPKVEILEHSKILELLLKNVIKNVFNNYYKDWKHDYIIDRSPWGTPFNLSYLKSFSFE